MEEIRKTCENKEIDNRFVERVMADVKQQCGGGYEVQVTWKTGNNGAAQMALSARRQGRPAGVVIGLELYWKQYQEGVPFHEIAGEISYMIRQSERLPGIGSEKIEYLLDFKNVKDWIIYQLVNLDQNKEELKEMPYKRVCGNLAAIFYLLVKAEGEWQSAVKIMKTHMEAWGTDEDELWHLAEMNTPNLRPAKLATMEEAMKELMKIGLAKTGCQLDENVIKEMLGVDKENECQGVQMYVLTNSLNMNGAAVMLYPGIMKWAAEQIGGDLIILPSSIHETILLKWDGHMGERMEDIRKIVHDVNQEVVSEEEILSDSIYRYRRLDGRIEWVV